MPSETDKRSGPHLKTSQMGKGILLDYQIGARRDGVVCHLYTRHAKESAKITRAYTFYETSVDGLANIARELVVTAPFRRSPKFQARIRKFKRYVAVPRRKTQKSVIEARRLCRKF